MSDFRNTFSQYLLSPDERARRLARVYTYILSLSDLTDKETKFGEDTTNLVSDTTSKEADAE
jgi:hypothetical protein